MSSDGRIWLLATLTNAIVAIVVIAIGWMFGLNKTPRESVSLFIALMVLYTLWDYWRGKLPRLGRRR